MYGRSFTEIHSRENLQQRKKISWWQPGKLTCPLLSISIDFWSIVDTHNVWYGKSWKFTPIIVYFWLEYETKYDLIYIVLRQIIVNLQKTVLFSLYLTSYLQIVHVFMWVCCFQLNQFAGRVFMHFFFHGKPKIQSEGRREEVRDAELEIVVLVEPICDFLMDINKYNYWQGILFLYSPSLLFILFPYLLYILSLSSPNNYI